MDLALFVRDSRTMHERPNTALSAIETIDDGMIGVTRSSALEGGPDALTGRMVRLALRRLWRVMEGDHADDFAADPEAPAAENL